ncbi:MAG: SGNH/GDSL hydrolase family protein [Alistipes sp.]|jgi:lysophospholipase L1-like esterase|nr:SGNH/GDSL hydrolase family protein [Alistipes sp.]
MKRVLIMATALALTATTATTAALAQNTGDWANYGRYADANAALKATGVRPDIVFMGNSITDGWASQHPEFFAGNNFVGRGIGGQVTAQMLARFRADVIDLSPRMVVILAGTNDIAQNQGFVSIENIAANIFSMADLARANGIEVVLCSVLPAAEYPWRPEIADVPSKVRALNALLREWAEANGCRYVDYFSPMADERGGLPKSLAADGIHPTGAGYDMMESIIKPTLRP